MQTHKRNNANSISHKQKRENKTANRRAYGKRKFDKEEHYDKETPNQQVYTQVELDNEVNERVLEETASAAATIRILQQEAEIKETASKKTRLHSTWNGKPYLETEPKIRQLNVSTYSSFAVGNEPPMMESQEHHHNCGGEALGFSEPIHGSSWGRQADASATPPQPPVVSGNNGGNGPPPGGNPVDPPSGPQTPLPPAANHHTKQSQHKIFIRRPTTFLNRWWAAVFIVIFIYLILSLLPLTSQMLSLLSWLVRALCVIHAVRPLPMLKMLMAYIVFLGGSTMVLVLVDAITIPTVIMVMIYTAAAMKQSFQDSIEIVHVLKLSKANVIRARDMFDLRADAISMQSLKHQDPLIGVATITIQRSVVLQLPSTLMTNKLEFLRILFWQQEKSMQGGVSHELVSQLTTSRNMNLRSDENISYTRFQVMADKMNTVNLSRYGTLYHEYVVANSVQTAFYLTLEMQQKHQYLHFPKVLTVQ